MTSDQYITLTLAQLQEMQDKSARVHVLTMLDELQNRKDSGMDLQAFILVKQHLYTYNLN